MRAKSIVLASCVLTLFAGSAVSQCGECDASPGSTILDALAAAKTDVGLIVMDPGLINSCDVDNNGVISVLDALRIAKRSSGLTQAYDCPLAPNVRPGVAPITPLGGESMGLITTVPISFTISDDNSDTVDIGVAFSPDWGFSWIPCTWVGSPQMNGVACSPGGDQIDLVWDIATDFGPVMGMVDTKLCIVVTDGASAAPSLVIDYFYLELP